MADEQDVFITGVGGGVAAWSTETTQKQIEGSLKQVQHDNNVMLQFLGKIAQKMSINVRELNAVKAEIQKNTQSETVASDKSEARATAETRYQVQGNQYLKAKMMVEKDILGAIQDQSRQQARESALEIALVKQGIDKDIAKQVAGEEYGVESRIDYKAKKWKEWSMAVVTIVKTLNDSLNTQFGERVTFTNQMRQSGLLAGMDKAAAGMLNMTSVVNEATFTLGEAAEFVKLFSETVGVKGVKETLNFVNKMADADSTHGWMQRLGMDFGQIADLSGEYLDTLRMSGVLRDRTDDQLAAGMEDFMNNVMMTSNVLKISMTEAAELMKNALDARQLGFLATMPGDQGEKLRATLSALGVSLKSTFGDALGMRMQLGSQQLFAHSQEFKDLQATPLGREILPFIEQLSNVYDNQGPEAFHKFFSEEYKGFTNSLTEFMKDDAMRAMSAAGSTMIQILGEMLPIKETSEDANAGMPLSSDAVITEMHMMEQKRKAARMSESVINLLMEAQIDNIKRETEARRDLTEQLSKTFEAWGPAITLFAEGASHLYTWSLGMLEWLLTSGGNHPYITEAIAQENPKLYSDLQAINATINKNQKDIEPRVTALMKTLLSDDANVVEAGKKALKELSNERLKVLRQERRPEFEKLLEAAKKADASEGMIDAINNASQRMERLIDVFETNLRR
jgi:hypothetical protein